MKRNLLIAFILLGLASALSCQDRIITLNNDTINCRISRITRTDILFGVTTSAVITSGKLPLSDIKSYTISAASGRSQDYEAVTGRRAGYLRLALNVSCPQRGDGLHHQQFRES